MADIKALVTSTPRNRVSVRTTGGGSGSGISQFANLLDVDASGVADGEVPVYDANSAKYVVKPIPGIDGGSF